MSVQAVHGLGWLDTLGLWEGKELGSTECSADGCRDWRFTDWIVRVLSWWDYKYRSRTGYRATRCIAMEILKSIPNLFLFWICSRFFSTFLYVRDVECSTVFYGHVQNSHVYTVLSGVSLSKVLYFRAFSKILKRLWSAVLYFAARCWLPYYFLTLAVKKSRTNPEQEQIWNGFIGYL